MDGLRGQLNAGAPSERMVKVDEADDTTVEKRKGQDTLYRALLHDIDLLDTADGADTEKGGANVASRE